jgi:hypothetical protein
MQGIIFSAESYCQNLNHTKATAVIGMGLLMGIFLFLLLQLP